MENLSETSSADLDALQAQAMVQGDAAVLSAVNQNTELLQQLVVRLQESSTILEPEEAFDEFNNLDFRAADDNAIEAVDENIRLREENTRLNQLINRLEAEVASLNSTNHDLAQKVVYGGSPEEADETTCAVPSAPARPQRGEGEALTWEERKQQIIEQMENDSFDAEVFLSTLDIKRDDTDEGAGNQAAIDYVVDLNSEMDKLRDSLRESQRQSDRHLAEIRELQATIKTHQENIASLEQALSEQPVPQVDPAQEILDADEVIQAERERLARSQEETEQKVRDIEIQSSLERAKLSRERTELEQRTKELEAQVKALQRSVGLKGEGNVGTRWMAKLGLTKDSEF